LGKVIVVGIGPGSYEDMTIRADRALQSCDAIVGYGVYVDLVKERYPDKAFYETPMTQEAKRCALALDLARAGKTAAMVCSGDSGIYGMAALVYELRGESEEPEIEVVPGLTAACSAAALLGAPLTHDFAVISLSDRLTPWETIEKRLTHAAKADLTIALYNPASRSRRYPAARPAGQSPLRHRAQHRPRGGKLAHPDARGAQRGRGRYVLHGDRRQRINEGNCGAAHHAARVQKCVRSAFLQARRRRADSWSF